MNQYDQPITLAMVEFEPLSVIHIAVPVHYQFLMHWVRRTAMRTVAGDLGTPFPAPHSATVRIAIHGDLRLVKSVDAEGRLRLRVYKTGIIHQCSIAITAPVPVDSNDSLTRALLGQTKLRDAIYREVPNSLKIQYARHCDEILSDDATNIPLIDASFAITEKGLDAWMKAVCGDFTFLNASSRDVECNRSSLPSLPNLASVMLYLPPYEGKEWKKPHAVLERAEVRTGDEGQIYAGWPEDRVMEYMIRLAGFAHTNHKPMHGTTIGDLAKWFDAPGDRDTTYTPAYGAMALAVQRILREEISRIWFSDPDHYSKFADSHAILVYRCSAPFLGRTRTEIGYEFQNPTSMRRFYRTATQTLGPVLEGINAQFKGSPVATHYRSSYTRDIVADVARRQNNLHRLMAAESAIIECLIQFGMAGRELRHRKATHAQHAADAVARYAYDFRRALMHRTRRLHGSVDFSRLAVPIFMEASRVLAEVLQRDGRVAA